MVDVARRRVGQRPDGSQAHGEWVQSDGWSTRLVSGPTDNHYEAAKEFAQTLPARDRAAQRPATHVEIKVAVAGAAAFAYSHGDPDSPAVIESEVGFPQGAGIPLETFTAALNEFLTDSDTPPPSVDWQQA